MRSSGRTQHLDGDQFASAKEACPLQRDVHAYSQVELASEHPEPAASLVQHRC